MGGLRHKRRFNRDRMQGGFVRQYWRGGQPRYMKENAEPRPLSFYLREVPIRLLEMIVISFVTSSCFLFVFKSLLWSYIISNKVGYERILIGLSLLTFFGLNAYLLRRMIIVTNNISMYILINSIAYIIYAALNIIVFFYATTTVYFNTFLYTLFISSFVFNQLTSLIITHVLYLGMLITIGIWGTKRFVKSELSVEDYRAMQRGRGRSIWRS